MELTNTPESFDVTVEHNERKTHDFGKAFTVNHIIDNSVFRLDYNGKVTDFTGDTAYSENAVKSACNVGYLLKD